MADLSERNALGSYWNGLAVGDVDAPPVEVSPDLAEAILWATRLDDTPPPDKDFVAQLGIRLRSDEPEKFLASFPINGSVPGLEVKHRTSSGPAVRSKLLTPFWRRTLPQTAFAAVLLVMLIGVVVIVDLGWRDDQNPTGGMVAPAFRGGPERSGVSLGPGPSATPNVLWRFPLESTPSNAVVIADGTVYVGDDPQVRMESDEPLGALHAVDIATGQERWRFPTAGGVSVPPTVDGGVVYVADNGGVVSAVDASTGVERWHLTVGDAFGYPSSPVVVGGLVYVQWTGAGGNFRSPAIANGLVVIAAGPYNLSATTALVAIDPATGVERWRTDDFPGDDSGYYAVDAATGAVQWRFATGSLPDATPAIAGDTAYLVGGSDGRLYAVDLVTGTDRWVANIGGQYFAASTPAVSDDVLYLIYRGEDGAAVLALDAATGTEHWRSPLDRDTAGAPLVAGDDIYTISVGGRLFVLSATDGRHLWSYDLPGSTAMSLTDGETHFAVPTIAGTTIFLCFTSEEGGTNRSWLYALGDATGA